MHPQDEFTVNTQHPSSVKPVNKSMPNLVFLFAGVLFGFVLTKAEVISWFRIQEMFQLKSFHMFGVIGSAVFTGMISLQIIKKFKLRNSQKEEMKLDPKPFHKGQIFGGLLFGFGWAMTGACPGPLFIQIGTGAGVILISLLSAIAGTWCYGMIQHKLPH